MNLDDARANVGNGVVYKRPDTRLEDGVITSVNDTYVFVRYAGDQTSKATRPEDLELLNRGLMCWCGGDVGRRVPGDRDGLGCLENINHNWKAGDRDHES